MIGIAFAVVFANSQKNTESMTDSADRFAGNANFGARHSLDNGFHDELAVEVACFFSLCINWISRGYVAVKKTTWPFMGFIYLVTKKIIVDNAAEGMRENASRVALVGSELRLKNSDPILHTVHARLGKEILFNMGLPRWRQVTKSLTRSGIIRIDCDVLHTWMSAAIVVTQSPYFALTDEHGRFVIEQLPAGEYDMETWREKLGTRNRWIHISESKQTAVDVV